MANEAIWEFPCHQGVEWKDVEKEVFLLQRTTPLFGNPDPVLTTVLIGLGILVLEEATAGLIRTAFKELYGKIKRSREERQKLRILRKRLFPFFLGADTFVGVRYPWFATTEKRLSIRDLQAAGGVMQGVLYTICSLIRRKPPIAIIQDKVDLAGNLIAIGGPIPNWYTRNLLYASKIDLPYRFRLDVESGLEKQSPAQLRQAGYLEGKAQPRWYVANPDGSVAKTSKGEETKPLLARKHTLRDFFMIVKTPNVFDGAKDTRALVLTGCHGLGTWAAGLSLKKLHVLEAIEKEAGNGYFQALGAVSASKKGKPDEDTIEIGPIVKL